LKVGVYSVLTAESIPVTTLARAVEERGFDSLWVPEHSHIPTTSIYPGGAGPVTREYGHTLDPFVVLAAAAGVTSRLKLGTGICLLIQRDTIQTAKAVASLDRLSGGRMLFGVGGGWNRPEMENHGTAYATRFQRLEEQLEAIKRIWTQDEPEFRGKHVRFEKMWCWPKPLAEPHPPIYIGGESDHTLKRVVAHADGWLPRMRDPQAVLAGIGRLRDFARAAGRDPKSLAVSAFGVAPRDDAIAPLRDAGVDRIVLGLPAEPQDALMRRLDGYAALVTA